MKDIEDDKLFSIYIPKIPVIKVTIKIMSKVPSGENFSISLWWIWSLPADVQLLPFLILEKIKPMQSKKGIATNQSIVIGWIL